MAKKGGDAVRHRVPLFLRPIVGRMRFLAPLALRGSATVSPRISFGCRTPTRSDVCALRLCSSLWKCAEGKRACFHLCTFVPHGALGVEQGDFVRYIGARAA